MNLIQETIRLCEELGVDKAAEFFEVSTGTISNWKRTQKPSADAVQKVFDYFWTEPPVPATNPSNGGPKVLIQVPVYERMTHRFAVSLLGLCRNAKTCQASLTFSPPATTIWRARNILATQLYFSDAEWGFMMDSDMVFPFGNAAGYNFLVGTGAAIPAEYAGLHTLDRLLSRNEPLIGVTYVSRHPKGSLHYGEAFRSDGENRAMWSQVPANRVQSVSWIATGGLLYHRSVLDRIIKGCPEVLDSDGVEPTRENGRHFAFFNPAYITPEGKLNMADGEDRAFMRRATMCGIQPKIDFSILAAHEGSVCWTTKNAQPR